jgi:hypothetical protein
LSFGQLFFKVCDPGPEGDQLGVVTVVDLSHLMFGLGDAVLLARLDEGRPGGKRSGWLASEEVDSFVRGRIAPKDLVEGDLSLLDPLLAQPQVL